jgi:protein TonB
MKSKAIKPEAVIVIGMDEIPLPSSYGAAEMKHFIRRNTYRGATIGLILLLLVLLISFIMETVERQMATEMKVAPITRMALEDLPPHSTETADIAPPPDLIINTGPAARAGNPVPVPDALIAPDLQDFATIDVIDRAGAEGGTGEDLGGFAANIDWSREREVATDRLVDRIPEPDEFIPVEKEPGIDMNRLQRLVVYPEMARKAGIEGTVFVRALVDRTGKISRVIIESSDNRALDQAAIRAVEQYGYATPAIMNQEPTTCWVTIPIVFRLR